MTEEFVYNKSKLTQLAIAVSLMLTVAGLLLILQTAVFADEQYDKQVCEDYNGEWKDIGKGDDRGCVFEDYDDVEKYGYRPGYSLDSTSGDAEYGIEDLVSYDNEGNKIYPATPEEEEKAAKKDAKCDDEDADTTDIEACMSDERKHHYVDVEIEKKVCDDEGGEWTKTGGCDKEGVYEKVGEKLAEREECEDKDGEWNTKDNQCVIGKEQEAKDEEDEETEEWNENTNVIASPSIDITDGDEFEQASSEEEMDKAIKESEEEFSEKEEQQTEESESEESSEEESDDDDDEGGEESESDSSSSSSEE